MAQTPPTDTRPLAERIAAFVAAPESVPRPDATCKALVRAVAEAAVEESARFELLQQLQQAARPLTQDTVAFVALALATCAFKLGDHERSIREAQVATTANGAGAAAQFVRREGIRFLFEQALRIGDVESAFPYLARYAEVVDPVSAGLAECQLLLRIGMVRQLAVLLDRLESGEVSAAQRQVIACLRLQEQLANEQFVEARDGAEVLLGSADLVGATRHQVELTAAFAMVRLGDVAAAESRLRTLLGVPGLRPEHATLARAELAMLRLQRGEAPAAAAEEIEPDRATPLAEAPDWSLAARARLLLATLAGGGEARDLSAVHAALLHRHRFMLRQWRATPMRSSGVAFLQWSVRRELLVCLCACEVALGGADAGRNCLQYLLEADACGSLARRLGAPVGSPEVLVQRVRPRHGLLVWLVPAPRGSLAVLVDDDGASTVSLPGDMELRGLVRGLRLAVRDETVLGREWRAPLAARTGPLADWLYQPRLRQILAANRRVTVLGRELLTGLPFEFLPSPSDPWQWFGLTHAIDYVPSATLATREPAVFAAREPVRLAVLAVTAQTEASAARYPGCDVPTDRQRLGSLAASVDAKAVEVEIAVDRARLRAALLGSDALVLLAHGRRRHVEDLEEESRHERALGVVLGDGFFGAEQLADVARMPSLVVLASCGTARAGVDRGEDGQLFGTAWLAAGSAMVLSADGDLELQATELLVSAFLRAITSGVEPAEALRQARVVVAADERFAHPAFHCALRIDVAGGEVVRLPAASAERIGRGWLAYGLGLLLAGAAFVWRRRAVPSGRRMTRATDVAGKP